MDPRRRRLVGLFAVVRRALCGLTDGSVIARVRETVAYANDRERDPRRPIGFWGRSGPRWGTSPAFDPRRRVAERECVLPPARLRTPLMSLVTASHAMAPHPGGGRMDAFIARENI